MMLKNVVRTHTRTPFVIHFVLNFYIYAPKSRAMQIIEFSSTAVVFVVVSLTMLQKQVTPWVCGKTQTRVSRTLHCHPAFG